MKKLIALFFLIPFFGFAQQAKIDSLSNLITTTKIDTIKVDALCELAFTYLSTDHEKIKQFADEAIELATSIKYTKGIANAYHKKAIYYYVLGNYDQALSIYQKALKVANNGKNLNKVIATINNGIAIIYYVQGNLDTCLAYYQKATIEFEKAKKMDKVAALKYNIGLVYYRQGKYEDALRNQLEALKISKSLNDVKNQCNAINAIGIIYRTLGKFEKALAAYIEAKELLEQLEIPKMLGIILGNIANVHVEMKQYEKAIEYYKKSFVIAKEMNDKQAKANCLVNLTTMYVRLKDFNVAFKYGNAAEELLEEVNDLTLIGTHYTNNASIYIHLEEYDKALENAKKAKAIYDETKYVVGLSDTHRYLYQSYKGLGQYKEALENHELYKMHEDTIFNQESTKMLSEMETIYESEKKEQQIKLQKIEIDKQLKEAQSQKFQKIAFASGFVLMLVLAFVVFRSYQQKRKDNEIISLQKNMVEEKNKEITDSITYAKRIQSAILPPNKLIKEYLKESFILYKPKDIVAGDFYWMEHKDGKVLFAAADCTGHGVPGAMVSVVCNNGLNRSVREYGLTDPGKILDKTREIVIQEFEKSEEDVKDGMDIALCSLENNKLKYAGANNPLWIIRNGKIIETKANKQPIGQFDNPKPYTTHTFELQQEDAFYIFSDGFVDQFGGENGKKFKAKGFKDLLLSIQNTPLAEQQKIIDQTFESWKGDLEQIDDVCVIGVRV